MSIAEEIMDGLLCERCGCLIDEHYTGYPRKCKDCESEEQQEKGEKILW